MGMGDAVQPVWGASDVEGELHGLFVAVEQIFEGERVVPVDKDTEEESTPRFALVDEQLAT